MRKQAILIAALALSLPILSLAEARSFEAQDRAYIQSGLTINSGRELSTGIKMSEDASYITVFGDAESFNATALDVVANDESLDSESLWDFRQSDGSFRLPNHDKWNQQYKLVTTGGEGTKTYKSENFFTTATHPQKIGLAAVLALLSEGSLAAIKFAIG